MTMSRFEAGILVGCAAMVSSAAPDPPAPMPQALPRATVATAKPPAGMRADMGAKCQTMTADHEKMMTEMNASGQRLNDLVARMNAASGMEKADATAAAVAEIVAQCLATRNRMVKMEQGMMALCPMVTPTGGMNH